jgi:SOS-response transcriptional repressor LexA
VNLYKVIAEQLEAGAESITFSPKGNSMTPRITSGQEITIHRLGADEQLETGNVVLAKVHGQYFLHKITAISDQERYLIANNHGRINGWTSRGKVYGKAEV